MKLTVLVDNNTIIDRYFYGEPAVSYLIETEDKKILFDTGYSDLFLQNANKLSKDLRALDFVVISHGHNDHTGGLVALREMLTPSNDTDLMRKKVRLVAHPDAFLQKVDNKLAVGSPIDTSELEEAFDVILTEEPLWLGNDLVFLGEIPRVTDFEGKVAIGKILKNNDHNDDYVFDDSALVYKAPTGLVIITGCSHAGICNIVEYAKKVCGDDRIESVIGGFHLLDPSKKQFDETLKYFDLLKTNIVYPCHCTGFEFKVELAKRISVKEVGVGLQLEFL